MEFTGKCPLKTLTPLKLTPEAIKSLDRLYRTARYPRLRIRAHMVLLAAEKSLPAEEIAEIVRTDAQTVRRWLQRYLDQGQEGLADVPRPGGPRKVTAAYLAELLRVAGQPPGAVDLPYARWTARRLADHMTAVTDIAVDPETVRLHLKAAGISLTQTPAAPPRPAGRTPAKHRMTK